jgi:hypothetical protein
LIWVLAAAAAGIAFVGLWSMNSTIGLYGSTGFRGGSSLLVRDGGLTLYYVRSRPGGAQRWMPDVSVPGFTYRVGPAYLPGRGARGEAVFVRISLWPIFLVYAAYPVFSFLYAPMRAARLRARNLCHNCRYILVGNESGVCPECGEPLAAAIAPQWRRIFTAVLCALIAGWVIEFVIDQTSLEHRIALAMIRILGEQVGAWMVASTVRIVPPALICVGVYVLLSPERFPGGRNRD